MSWPDFGGERKMFNKNTPTPIVFGMQYPGIVLVFGVPYNDPSVSPPCYRIGPPSVGWNNAVWVESEPEPEPKKEEPPVLVPVADLRDALDEWNRAEDYDVYRHDLYERLRAIVEPK